MTAAATALALSAAALCIGCLDDRTLKTGDGGVTLPPDPPADSGTCPLTPCRIQSEFPGDEACPPVPRTGFGAVVHYGPEEYSDPAELTRYLVAAGTTAVGNTATVILGPDSTREVRASARPGMVRASLTLNGNAVMTVSAGVTEKREEQAFAAWSNDTFGTIDVQCRNTGDVPLLCEAWFLVALGDNVLSLPCANE